MLLIFTISNKTPHFFSKFSYFNSFLSCTIKVIIKDKGNINPDDNRLNIAKINPKISPLDVN